MKTKIPLLVAVPAFLIACEETEPTGDTGADVGTDATSDAESTDTGEPVDEDVTIPATAPDLTSVNCSTVGGVDAFFCDWVTYCGWFADCYPEDFSDEFNNVASCEASYAASLASSFAGTTVDPACVDAWAAIAACRAGGCDAECEYAPVYSACDWLERR